MKEIVLLLTGVALGAVFSWIITHFYYKKNLKNQEQAASKEIDEWKKLVSSQEKFSKEALRLDYIDKAVVEHKQKGTPVRVIDTFDISNDEKADIYDAVMMRVKGRLGKSNKYRNQS